MNVFRLLSLCCLILCFLTFTFAQVSASTEVEAEKVELQKELEKRVLQMIDQAVNDASYLRLPQNKAVIYAIAGDLYWKFDEKRARELFRNSANEIVVEIAEAEKEKRESEENFPDSMQIGGAIRYEILPLVAKHDADLALELLVQTRPPKTAEALAKNSQPNAKQESEYMNFNPDQQQVRQEIALEQQFAVLAAEQNPDKAIKLIKESLAKGISWNVLLLLQKINKKDEKKAAQLADEIIGKLIDTDLTKKQDDLSAAIMFLQSSTYSNVPKDIKEKLFKFSDAQLKIIAGKLVDTFLERSNSLEMTRNINLAMPSLEKIIPERLPALKQKYAQTLKNLPPEVKQFEQRQKLWNPDSTPEDILADLSKMNNEYEKASAYNILAYKISQIEDESRAKKLIEQIPNEKARENALDSYESMKISRTAKAGKLEDAKQMIGNLTKKKTQIQKLVSLAVEFHKKGREADLETAEKLMKDAENLANVYIEDEDDLNNLMEVISGYVVVKPDEAFRIVEPVIDELNEYIQASAVLSKYDRRNRNFKRGELLMKIRGYSWDGLLLFRYVNQIQLLGKSDLSRMNTLSDKFQRADARSIVKLFIVQGFLKEEKKDEN